MARKTHAEIIAKRCYDEARSMLGSGWNHVSVEVQQALVYERVLFIVYGQDESIPAETVLAFMGELIAEVGKYFTKEA